MVYNDGEDVSVHDHRFDPLLEPIRDISKNWEIDLAHLLDLYMRDVEATKQMTSTVEDRSLLMPSQGPECQSLQVNLSASQTVQTILNFAQAAMLVQGGAYVYGKKVDYLYELTFRFCENIHKSGKNHLETNVDDDSDQRQPPDGCVANNKQKRKGQRDFRTDLNWEDGPEPLPNLDDIQPSQNVDLNEDDNDDDAENSDQYNEHDVDKDAETDENANNHQWRPCRQQPPPNYVGKVSTSRRRRRRYTIWSRCLADLTPLEDYEKSNVILTDKNGELIGKKDDFRMNSGHLHESGALLINRDYERFIGIDLSNTASEAPFIMPSNAISLSPVSACSYPVPKSPTLPVESSTAVLATTNFVGHEGASDDEGWTADDPPSSQDASIAVEQTNLTQGPVTRNSKPDKNQSDVKNEAIKKLLQDQEKLKFLDEFETLDNNGKANKKFSNNGTKKSNRIFKIPPPFGSNCLPEVGKKRRRNIATSSSSVYHQLIPLYDFIEEVSLSKKQSKNLLKSQILKTSHLTLSSKCFPELETAILTENKRRRRQLEVQKKNLTKVKKQVEHLDPELERFKALNANVNFDDSAIDRNLMAIFEGPIRHQNDSDDEAEPEPHVAGSLNDNGQDQVVRGQIDQLDDLNDDDFHSVDEFHSIGKENDGSENSNNFFASSSETYAQTVEREVERYLKLVSQDACLTDLAQRVRAWENKIKPQLEKEERRRHFDVIQYGNQILHSLLQQNQDHQSGDKHHKRLAFKELVKDQPAEEICRFALASLMLANEGNVELNSVESADENVCVNTMTLKYLSSQRHHQLVKDYAMRLQPEIASSTADVKLTKKKKRK